MRRVSGGGGGDGASSAGARRDACRELNAEEIAAAHDLAWTQHQKGEGEGEGETEDENTPAHASWQQHVFIHRVIAAEEKHIFVCAKERPPTVVTTLHCGGCGRGHPAMGYPNVCGQCQGRLVRFALS
jgi:hypothetical protein|eukprot:SAG25_NODE_16_length_24288_cov_31.926950_10_plen_128_part_00